MTWPLGLAAISLASCQPVGVTVLLGLGVAPVLGTVGDLSWRSGHPIRVAGWWLRNVLASAIRMIGPVVVLALGLGIWWITDAVDSVADASPWVLRITGGLCGWMVAAATARGSRRVRSDLGLDAVTRRLLPRGRMTTQALVLVIVAIAVAAAGLWFRPEAWPFGA